MSVKEGEFWVPPHHRPIIHPSILGTTNFLKSYATHIKQIRTTTKEIRFFLSAFFGQILGFKGVKNRDGEMELKGGRMEKTHWVPGTLPSMGGLS
jgi:hypothetical protein